MLGKLLLAFILIPIAEFFLLIWVAEQTSLLTTILLVIVTGIVGSLLARQQGVRVWQRLRLSLAEGKMPSQEIQDGLLIAIAAVLLLTPGLISDSVGLMLLIPSLRGKVRRAMARRFASSVRVRTFQHGPLDASFDPRRTDSVEPTRPTRVERGNTIDAAAVRRVP